MSELLIAFFVVVPTSVITTIITSAVLDWWLER